MYKTGIKRALYYILVWIQIIILLIQNAVNANAILFQQLSHQDYHIIHVINVELKIKKQEWTKNVHMIKENHNVGIVMGLRFVVMIKENHFAGTVMGLLFVFMLKKNHIVEIVMGLHFVFIIKENQYV